MDIDIDLHLEENNYFLLFVAVTRLSLAAICPYLPHLTCSPRQNGEILRINDAGQTAVSGPGQLTSKLRRTRHVGDVRNMKTRIHNSKKVPTAYLLYHTLGTGWAFKHVDST